MTARQAVIDACSILNLLATMRADEIIHALNLHLLDTPQVRPQPIYLLTLPNAEGQRQREQTSTESLRQAGCLQTHPLDTDALIDAFVSAAALINDPDASCIALAGALNVPLITDDRKERRIAVGMFPRIELISTLDLLHDASAVLSWSDEELALVARNLRWRGNFAPPRQDPRRTWYLSLLEVEEGEP